MTPSEPERDIFGVVPKRDYERRGGYNGLHTILEPQEVITIVQEIKKMHYSPSTQSKKMHRVIARNINHLYHHDQPTITSAHISSLLRHMERDRLTIEDFQDN